MTLRKYRFCGVSGGGAGSGVGSSAGVSVDGDEGSIGVDGISGSGVAIGLAQAPRMDAVARTVVNIMLSSLISIFILPTSSSIITHKKSREKRCLWDD